MPEAKLIKTLEEEGFYLEFPSYQSREEIIVAILKENNSRIYPSLALLLNKSFDYSKILSQIYKKQKSLFDKSISICENIYRKEKISNLLKDIIKEHKIRAKFSESEFKNYYETYKEASIRKLSKEQADIEEQSKLRLQLDLRQSLQILFSPAKLRIMEAIFNHQQVSNTELKYYYKAISPINRAVLNKALQDYLQVIENVKKHRG